MAIRRATANIHPGRYRRDLPCDRSLSPRETISAQVLALAGSSASPGRSDRTRRAMERDVPVYFCASASADSEKEQVPEVDLRARVVVFFW